MMRKNKKRKWNVLFFSKRRDNKRSTDTKKVKNELYIFFSSFQLICGFFFFFLTPLAMSNYGRPYNSEGKPTGGFYSIPKQKILPRFPPNKSNL